MASSSSSKHLAALAAIVIGCGVILAAGPSQAAEGRLKEILERGTVKVGVQGAFKPWSFPAPDGTLQGIEVDLGKSVADTLGVMPTFAVSAGGYEIVTPTLGLTDRPSCTPLDTSTPHASCNP